MNPIATRLKRTRGRRRRLSSRFASVPAILAAVAASLWATPELRAETEILTLAEVRSRVIEANADLEASAQRLVAAEGAVRQAGRMPNPSLEFEYENFGLDLPSSPAEESTIALGQTIELGGKRRLRVEQAKAARRIVALDRDDVRRELLAMADEGFIELLAGQQRLEIAREDLETARSMVRTVRDLVETGEVSPIELPRVEGELGMVEAELSRVEAQVETAAVRLAALWGGAESPRAIGELVGLLDDAVAHAGDQRIDGLPRLEKYSAEAERAEAVAQAARREIVPDLDLALGYRRFNEVDESALVLTAGISLPLWDRKRGAQAEAEALAVAARRDREAELARLRAEFRAAKAELVQAEREVEIITDNVLPKAHEVFQAVSGGYSLGELPLLDLLDARRALTGTRARLVDAHQRLALARAAILRLLPGHVNESGDAS